MNLPVVWMDFWPSRKWVHFARHNKICHLQRELWDQHVLQTTVFLPSSMSQDGHVVPRRSNDKHFNYMNKLSLVGMQLPEKYKDNFKISNWNSPYIFSVSCIPTKESFFIWLALTTLANTVSITCLWKSMKIFGHVVRQNYIKHGLHYKSFCDHTRNFT
jgi:hypothetical protein